MSGRTSKRDRRRAAVEVVRDTWEDAEFGLRLQSLERGGAYRVTFTADADPGLALMGIRRLRSLGDMLEEEAVLALRQQGESWDDIGWCLDVTGESVRRAYAAREAEYLEGVERGSA